MKKSTGTGHKNESLTAGVKSGIASVAVRQTSKNLTVNELDTEAEPPVE